MEGLKRRLVTVESNFNLFVSRIENRFDNILDHLNNQNLLKIYVMDHHLIDIQLGVKVKILDFKKPKEP